MKKIETSVEREILTEGKKAVTIKLQKTIADTLKQLAKQYKVSQADLVAVLIYSLAMGYDKQKVEEWLMLAANL